MARYCPNCSAELKDTGAACWNCGAKFFTADAAWRPTEKPLGEFQPRAVPYEKRAAAQSTAGTDLPPRRGKLSRPWSRAKRLWLFFPGLIAFTGLMLALPVLWTIYWPLIWISLWWALHPEMPSHPVRYALNALGCGLAAGVIATLAYFLLVHVLLVRAA